MDSATLTPGPCSNGICYPQQSDRIMKKITQLCASGLYAHIYPRRLVSSLSAVFGVVSVRQFIAFTLRFRSVHIAVAL